MIFYQGLPPMRTTNGLNANRNNGSLLDRFNGRYIRKTIAVPQHVESILTTATYHYRVIVLYKVEERLREEVNLAAANLD